MSTRDELLDGADFEGYEALCDDIVNMFKNHWRQSDPRTALTDAQPGMIASDEDDEKLWHKLGIGGPVSGACLVSGSPDWDEILQANMSCDTTPLFTSVDLGDNAIMTDSRAMAYLASDQENIPNATWTKVLLDTEDYDSGGNFDVGNNRFVARVSGFYLVLGMVVYSSVVADEQYRAAIYVDGSRVRHSRHHASCTDAISAEVFSIPVVMVTETIELYAYHNAGVGTVDIISGQTDTFMAVHLLSI